MSDFDGGGSIDSGSSFDSGSVDSGSSLDSGSVDSGSSFDSGSADGGSIEMNESPDSQAEIGSDNGGSSSDGVQEQMKSEGAETETPEAAENPDYNSETESFNNENNDAELNDTDVTEPENASNPDVDADGTDSSETDSLNDYDDVDPDNPDVGDNFSDTDSEDGNSDNTEPESIETTESETSDSEYSSADSPESEPEKNEKTGSSEESNPDNFKSDELAESQYEIEENEESSSDGFESDSIDDSSDAENADSIDEEDYTNESDNDSLDELSSEEEETETEETEQSDTNEEPPEEGDASDEFEEGEGQQSEGIEDNFGENDDESGVEGTDKSEGDTESSDEASSDETETTAEEPEQPESDTDEAYENAEADDANEQSDSQESGETDDSDEVEDNDESGVEETDEAEGDTESSDEASSDETETTAEEPEQPEIEDRNENGDIETPENASERTEKQSEQGDDAENNDAYEKNARLDYASYNQGQNDYGALGTCGPTSIANSLNRITGSLEYTENDVLHHAMDNGLCSNSSNPYEMGGTTTGDVVSIIDDVKNPDSNIHTEVYDYDNALSVNDLANRLDDPQTVAMVGVDSATLWDKNGNVANSGLFQHVDAPSDHWITVDSPVRDGNGDVVGFNVIDSGGGVDYVDRDKFASIYKGDANHTVTDPTAILISNHGESTNTYSTPYSNMYRTSDYKGSAFESDGGDPPSADTTNDSFSNKEHSDEGNESYIEGYKTEEPKDDRTEKSGDTQDGSEQETATNEAYNVGTAGESEESSEREIPFLREQDRKVGNGEFADDNGRIYRVNNDLLPNNEYELNGYQYKTDEIGRIKSAEGNLQVKDDRPRLNIYDNKGDIGKGYEKITDDRGHIIGDQFNGSNGLGNIIPQDADVNQKSYKNLENKLADEVKSGKDVFVKAEISYSDESRRPDRIVLNYTVNGVQFRQRFRN